MAESREAIKATAEQWVELREERFGIGHSKRNSGQNRRAQIAAREEEEESRLGKQSGDAQL